MVTYVNNLRLSEIATGDSTGDWGTITNTNLEIVGQAVAWGTRAVANASTDNITIADGALDAAVRLAQSLFCLTQVQKHGLCTTQRRLL